MCSAQALEHSVDAEMCLTFTFKTLRPLEMDCPGLDPGSLTYQLQCLDKVLNFSEPQFSYLLNGVNKSNCLMGLLRTLNDTVQIRFLEYLAHSKPSINVITVITYYYCFVDSHI